MALQLQQMQGQSDVNVVIGANLNAWLILTHYQQL
jgi:hypothetical protein